MAERFASIAHRYRRWEARVAGGFDGWTVRHRWVVLVLAPMLLICSGGTVVGMPAAWVLRMTIEASRGAPSPDAAANDYLMALSYAQQDGLLPILDNRRQDALLAQWRGYLAAMQASVPPPARLDFGSLNVGPIVHGTAEVSTDVTAVWWSGAGTGSGYNSHPYPWRFATRQDNGWQVSAVQAPAWCGGYVRTDACARR